MGSRFFFTSALNVGTYLLEHINFSNEPCESIYGNLIEAIEKCNITSSAEVPSNHMTLLASHEGCKTIMGVGGTEILLMKETNTTIDAVFEKCMTETFKLFFDPDNYEDTWFYKYGAYMFLCLFLWPIPVIPFLIIYSKFFKESRAQDDFQRAVLNNNIHQQSSNNIVSQAPRIIFRAVQPLRKAIFERNRNALSFSQRLANIVRKSIFNINIPPLFLCPIGRDLIDDPVTVSTGITYDRNQLKMKFEREGNPTSILCERTGDPIYEYEYKNYQSTVEIKTLILGFIVNAERNLSISDQEPSSAPINLPVNYISLGDRQQSQTKLPLATQRQSDLESNGYKIKIPESLLCPLTLVVMNDPITASSGITFEREELRMYFRKKKTVPCPLTTLKIDISEVNKFKTNVIIKKLTADFLTREENHKANKDLDIPEFPSLTWTQNLYRFFSRAPISDQVIESKEERATLLRRGSQ